MSFRDRLLLVINELQLNRNSFAERLGYENNSYIYDYTREKPKPKEPGFDFFHRFVQAKTGINLEWLLTGEGSMKGEKHTAATKSNEAAVRQELEALREEIRYLKRMNMIQAESILKLSGGQVIEEG